MIDSHCHLNFDSLTNDLISIIQRAKENNITAILTINTNPEEFKSHYQLIKKHQSLFITYGLHPGNVNSSNIPSIEKINLKAVLKSWICFLLKPLLLRPIIFKPDK